MLKVKVLLSSLFHKEIQALLWSCLHVRVFSSHELLTSLMDLHDSMYVRHPTLTPHSRTS
jgi:hypothetical protein